MRTRLLKKLQDCQHCIVHGKKSWEVLLGGRVRFSAAISPIPKPY